MKPLEPCVQVFCDPNPLERLNPYLVRATVSLPSPTREPLFIIEQGRSKQVGPKAHVQAHYVVSNPSR